MKRVYNLIVFGMLIVSGLGAYVVQAGQTDTEWTLAVQENEEAWEGRTVQLINPTSSPTMNVTLEGVQSLTRNSYLDKVSQYQEEIIDVPRAFIREMKQMYYSQYIRTEEGIVGLGHSERGAIVLVRSDKDGKVVKVKFRPLYEVTSSQWSGIFLNDNQVHLIYRVDGESARTKLAVFNVDKKTIETKYIDSSMGFITEVEGTKFSRLFDSSQSKVSPENKWIPVRVSQLTTFEEDTGGTYTSLVYRPALFAYDVEQNKIVVLESDAEYYDKTIVGNEYRVIRKDGSELVVDLTTGNRFTRQLVSHPTGSFEYTAGNLYYIRQIDKGVAIDVFGDGRRVSRATVTTENSEALKELDHTDFYVE